MIACAYWLRSIESLIEGGTRVAVQSACAEFMSAASEFYGVPKPTVSALAARPIRVREGGWATELFGDYSPGTAAIRIWTRTAIQKKATSPGTFLSTLCHEFCHHLDCQRFGFTQSPHTRGFYERTAALYHHARGTPRKPLVWVRMPKERWRIDWQRMNRPVLGAGRASWTPSATVVRSAPGWGVVPEYERSLQRHERSVVLGNQPRSVVRTRTRRRNRESVQETVGGTDEALAAIHDVADGRAAILRFRVEFDFHAIGIEIVKESLHLEEMLAVLVVRPWRNRTAIRPMLCQTRPAN